MNELGLVSRQLGHYEPKGVVPQSSPPEVRWQAIVLVCLKKPMTYKILIWNDWVKKMVVIVKKIYNVIPVYVIFYLNMCKKM